MAESEDAVPFRVDLEEEALESLDLSSGRFSSETKTVDFEGCSVDAREASKLVG